ncbi:hypothetical protein BX589_101211 [Paraburkholderia fungorum]|jgi:hypothetical protein|uniref:hypothetical protein n=1 Tax=Paraburkholderia fungorum TaxID=134537 RepID=UPI000D07B4B3|nr:hypothetical protein [Paraburkholderia fungorum]PRZ56561.1 hypothetical protein BX589_101211 [Paraburkholderia fungorum]
MDRLIAPNSVIAAQADAAPATGTPQFATDGNPASNIPATQWPAYQYNAFQEELIAILAAAAITPDRTKNNQVVAAIKRLMQNTVVLADTGVVNTYTAVNSVPLVAGTWSDGVMQAVKIAHTNTGPSTYAPDGLAPIPIYGLGLQPLQGNELLLNGTAILMHLTIAGVNAGNPICLLMECAGGAQQIPPALQSQHAAQLQQIGHGQCRLSVASTTSLKLSPYNGNNVVVNGVPLQIPSAGITYTLSGLAASTVYYVYLSGTTAAPVLSVSTTGHVTGSNGVEVKSGDPTQTLIGMVRTNSSTQFVDTYTQRFCVNWFNRRTLSCQYALPSGVNFTNTSSAILSSTFIVEFLTWADESVFAIFDGYCLNNTAGNAVQLVSGADGLSNVGSPQTFNSYNANANGNFSSSYNNFFVEGYHYTSLFGNVNGGQGTIAIGSQTKCSFRG